MAVAFVSCSRCIASIASSRHVTIYESSFGKDIPHLQSCHRRVSLPPNWFPLNTFQQMRLFILTPIKYKDFDELEIDVFKEEHGKKD